MIRWPRVAVSASVQSGRMFGWRLMFGSGAFWCVASSAEGVLLTLPSVADTGADRRPVATPLDQKSLRGHPIDVRTPSSSQRSAPTRFGDRGASVHRQGIRSMQTTRWGDATPSRHAGLTLSV